MEHPLQQWLAAQSLGRTAPLERPADDLHARRWRPPSPGEQELLAASVAWASGGSSRPAAAFSEQWLRASNGNLRVVSSGQPRRAVQRLAAQSLGRTAPLKRPADDLYARQWQPPSPGEQELLAASVAWASGGSSQPAAAFSEQWLRASNANLRVVSSGQPRRAVVR
ncbi:hypothetical protein Dimus_005746 [Dionaea muscipula]